MQNFQYQSCGVCILGQKNSINSSSTFKHHELCCLVLVCEHTLSEHAVHIVEVYLQA